MSVYWDGIAKVTGAIRIRSGASYSWDGRLYPGETQPFLKAAAADLKRAFLHAHLQAHLYSDFYCRSNGSALVKREARLRARGGRDFESALSRANCGRGYWSRGWVLVDADEATARVRKEGLTLCVSRSHMSVEAPEPSGGLVRIGMPKEFFGLSPGYYVGAGEVELPGERATDWVRVYLNLTPAGAVAFMRMATCALNRAEIPFNLKALSDPAHYDRCDTVVLYVDRGNFVRVADLLAAVLSGSGQERRSGVPALTKELAVGVGLAENPSAAESFGQHRCGLLADGIIRAHECGASTTAERVRVIARRFAEAGLDFDAPYLNPGSADIYALPGERRSGRRNATPVPGGTGRNDTARFRRMAEAIGRRLVETAFWHDDRCTWIGVNHQPDVFTPGAFQPTYETLGPGLYSGTSGVALFLAELARVSGEAGFGDTSAGAMRQAMRAIEGAGPGGGLFEGRLGIAFAGIRVAALLHRADLREQAVNFVMAVLDEADREQEPDLLCGTAGAIVALLALSHMLEDETLVDSAVRLGDDLIATAERGPAGYSWASRVARKQRHLTGLSHGAAGIGYALVELYAATGAGRFRRAASMAFAYERTCFDAQRCNWPDFRGVFGRGQTLRSGAPCSLAWCHGAPGIALSRIRAHEVLGGDDYRAEARIALDTTSTSLRDRRDLDSGNYSLCHGLCGNAAVLLEGRRLPQWNHQAGVRLAHRLADHGLARYGENGDWPCGGGRGETPGLMLGLAGIGSFYLHLHDQALPSIAMLTPVSAFRACSED